VPVVVADACGAGEEEAARHSLELLGHAGDAIFADVSTISVRLRQAAAGPAAVE
jgi:hypothetical protein